MGIWEELAELERKLTQLKAENDRLFATNIELRINQLLIQERLEDIKARSQYLSSDATLRATVSRK